MSKILSVTRVAVIGMIVVTLSGCKLFDVFSKRKVDQEKIVSEPSSENNLAKSGIDKTLVYMGKERESVLTEGEFNKYITQILKMYPQLNGAVDINSLPVAFKKTFLNKIIDQKIIIREAKSQNYEDGEKFKKDLAEATKLLGEHMLIQEFEKHIIGGIEVTDSEVKSEFDKNKSKYIKAEGGVLVAGIQFDNEAEASAFLDKTKSKSADEFASLAKDTSGLFKNFGRVNKESRTISLPEVVKNSAVMVSKFPTITKIKENDKVWVLHFSDKKDAEYYSFDDIKGQIENFLKSQKFQTALNKQMDVLRKKYPVEVAEELLESKQLAVEKTETAAIAG